MRGFARRTPAVHAAWLEWTGPRRRARVIVGAAAAALASRAGDALERAIAAALPEAE